MVLAGGLNVSGDAAQPLGSQKKSLGVWTGDRGARSPSPRGRNRWYRRATISAYFPKTFFAPHDFPHEMGHFAGRRPLIKGRNRKAYS
jgi:hypothetical protein